MSIEDWTRDQCAQHWEISPSTWSGYVTRGHAPQPYTHVGRTPLWDADTVRGYPRPGQGSRSDLVMPDEMPVIHQTTVGARDGNPSGKIGPLARRWHVSVADRAARGDTLMAVVTPDGRTVAEITWTERLAEHDTETAESAEWLVSAARRLWAATPRLLAGAAPAEVWEDVADAWRYSSIEAYRAWAAEVVSCGVSVPAYL